MPKKSTLAAVLTTIFSTTATPEYAVAPVIVTETHAIHITSVHTDPKNPSYTVTMTGHPDFPQGKEFINAVIGGIAPNRGAQALADYIKNNGPLELTLKSVHNGPDNIVSVDYTVIIPEDVLERMAKGVLPNDILQDIARAIGRNDKVNWDVKNKLYGSCGIIKEQNIAVTATLTGATSVTFKNTAESYQTWDFNLPAEILRQIDPALTYYAALSALEGQNIDQYRAPDGSLTSVNFMYLAVLDPQAAYCSSKYSLSFITPAPDGN